MSEKLRIKIKKKDNKNESGRNEKRIEKNEENRGKDRATKMKAGRREKNRHQQTQHHLNFSHRELLNNPATELKTKQDGTTH